MASRPLFGKTSPEGPLQISNRIDSDAKEQHENTSRRSRDVDCSRYAVIKQAYFSFWSCFSDDIDDELAHSGARSAMGEAGWG